MSSAVRDKMGAKQLEKQLETVKTLHQQHTQYWAELEGELHRTLQSAGNHSEQIQTFSTLQLSTRLEICREFPDIKDQLLQKLSNLSLQFELKLQEYHQTFSHQREAMEELSDKCFSLASSLPLTQLVEVRPGELCLASRLEQTNRLTNLYNSVELGLASWLDQRHQDLAVWNISSHLAQLSLYSL